MFGSFFLNVFWFIPKKILLTPHLQLFLEIPFSRISRGENCQQKSQRIHYFKEEGTRKLCYFFPRNFCWCGFKVFKKKSSKKHYLPYFILHFQVGVVALSIVCHIWKIVPDLYEAIIQIMPTSVPETNITDLLNHCSIHPGEIGEVRTWKKKIEYLFNK